MRWRDETQLAAEHLGYEVVETDGVTDWQGWGVHLLRKDGSWAVLAWSYGSCGACDRYEDEIYDDRGRSRAMRPGVRGTDRGLRLRGGGPVAFL